MTAVVLHREHNCTINYHSGNTSPEQSDVSLAVAALLSVLKLIFQV